MGVGELLLFVFGLVVALPLFFAPVAGAIDAALHPDAAWRGADQNKLAWVVALLGAALLPPFGFLALLAYLLSVRPKVVAARRR